MADFDWKGKSGDQFAEHKPATVEETDRDTLLFLQATSTQVFKDVILHLGRNGFGDVTAAKVIDVGCSTGGKLAVLESLGFSSCNLFGIDVSPKAIEIAGKMHPSYHFKEVNGFMYDVFDPTLDFDLVYHSAVFCQVPEASYDDFFKGIKSLKPRFYMFMEGICPRGPVKVPNTIVHDLFRNQDHSSHHHHGHSHEHAGVASEVGNHHFMIDSGYHYIDNLENVVAKFYPEAKPLATIKLDLNPKFRSIFDVLHMDYFLVGLYKICEECPT